MFGTNKKVILVANKIDNAADESDGYSLWNLGLGEPNFVSALHGRGSGDLLDLLIKSYPKLDHNLLMMVIEELH